ncbi:ABC transporter permease [Lachnoclostridium phytofermentans]|uniref:Binding-protein-dependent transport systems inner membrane component n=1 Tax=Lachnoclostridium phytofermentans (strain ATCC 700394 / DSM 18823 / ISDg) TaxID=357809 RepID=A9KKL8_LACP7|nr:ABC transporter permease [Lachnoclostridium phytofermentans]ABX41189.1 binding-protein-dependent transport systems inner membrane component [Lachnoclostridium phytofermentans ISDg]
MMHRIKKEDYLSASAIHQAYLKRYQKRVTKIRIAQWIIFLSFLILWELSTRVGWLNSFIFSSPSRVVKCFATMAKDGTVFYHIGITLFETFISFGLVIGIGLLVAVLLWWNESVAKVLEPYLVVLNSLPKSALAPVFIVWLGNNMKTIIVAAVTVAVFGTIITLYTNFNSTEQDKYKLIYTLGGTKKDVLFKVVLPGNLPSIISCMKVNIGLSLVGVIIGEFLAAKAGLGYLIVYGSQVFKLDWVIMSIVILCIIATALYGILSYIERRVRKNK